MVSHCCLWVTECIFYSVRETCLCTCARRVLHCAASGKVIYCISTYWAVYCCSTCKFKLCLPPGQKLLVPIHSLWLPLLPISYFRQVHRDFSLTLNNFRIKSRFSLVFDIEMCIIYDCVNFIQLFIFCIVLCSCLSFVCSTYSCWLVKWSLCCRIHTKINKELFLLFFLPRVLRWLLYNCSFYQNNYKCYDQLLQKTEICG
jgi:hypothetical protein